MIELKLNNVPAFVQSQEAVPQAFLLSISKPNQTEN